MDTCAVCGRPGPLQMCAGCAGISYCSVHCQGRDWPQHQPHCRPRQTYTDRDTSYSVPRLMAYSRELPTMHVPVHLLTPQLLVACWTDANNMPVSPSDVMSHMDEFPDHAARIRAADMSWCVLLGEDNTVIDGMHRLCRAVLDGDWVTMRVKYIPDDMMKQAAICTQCGAHPVAVLCDICSLAGYCSAECRERHWPMHSTSFCQLL